MVRILQILNPCVVWKIYYCGKKSAGGGMAIFFVQKNDGQRKLGSNTSVLRTSRIVRLDIDEGWCATET